MSLEAIASDPSAALMAQDDAFACHQLGAVRRRRDQGRSPTRRACGRACHGCPWPLAQGFGAWAPCPQPAFWRRSVWARRCCWLASSSMLAGSCSRALRSSGRSRQPDARHSTVNDNGRRGNWRPFRFRLRGFAKRRKLEIRRRCPQVLASASPTPPPSGPPRRGFFICAAAGLHSLGRSARVEHRTGNEPSAQRKPPARR